MIKPILRVAAFTAVTLSAALHAQTFEKMHQFTGVDGEKPEQAMTLGPDGNFYGVTTEGGLNDDGVVFRFTPSAPEGERLTVLHSFNRLESGYEPRARLINVDGYLYGATKRGTGVGNGGGVVFRVDTTGAFQIVKKIPSPGGQPYKAMSLASGEPGVLHVLCEDPPGILRVPLDNPDSMTVASQFNVGQFAQSFIRAKDGFLYGGMYAGGNHGGGILFRTNGDGSNFTPLHHAQSATGTRPIGAMVQGKDGMLYGLMSHAGKPGDDGVLYRIDPANPQASYTPIRYFSDFSYQYSDLLLASDGMLYGTGWAFGPGGNGNGGVWRINPNGTGYKVLHVFQTGSGPVLYPTGRVPVGGLVQGPDGNIYGTTQGGVGSGAAGTIFRLKLKLPPPPLNRAPIAIEDIGVSNGAPVIVNVKANDYDPDGDPLNVIVKVQPALGVAQVNQDGAIVYTPGVGYSGEDAFQYEISDGRGGKSTGWVQITDTQPGPLFVAGGYNGLVSRDPNLNNQALAPRGQFLLTVKENRSFTGTLIAGTKRIALRGVFNEAGQATTKVTMPDRKAADVYFSYVAGSPSRIFVAVYGSEIWTGDAGPVRKPVGEPTKNLTYTVQILANPAIDDGPVGHGYGTVTIKPTGAVSVIGKLGDGSNLKWSSSLTELPGFNRVIPAYSEPVKGGYISGLLFSTNDPGEDFAADLLWSRPASLKDRPPYQNGFEGGVVAQVSRFIPPAATAPILGYTAGEVAVFGPPLAPVAIVGEFTVNGNKITVNPSSPKKLVSFTINRTTGIFSGVMKTADGRKNISFKGAMNQALGVGYGQFLNAGETGSAIFGAD